MYIETASLRAHYYTTDIPETNPSCVYHISNNLREHINKSIDDKLKKIADHIIYNLFEDPNYSELQHSIEKTMYKIIIKELNKLNCLSDKNK